MKRFLDQDISGESLAEFKSEVQAPSFLSAVLNNSLILHTSKGMH